MIPLRLKRFTTLRCEILMSGAPHVLGLSSWKIN